MSAYPSPAAIATFTNTVRPVGARDPSLWGYAFAAFSPSQFAETGSQGLSDFQAFYARVFVVVQSTGWDSDFVLGYIQMVGDFPQSADAFGSWLTQQGYGDGHGGKTGKYPTGGLGYPPGGGAMAGTGTGTATPATPSDSVSATFNTALAFVKKNPIPVAVGGLAALILFGRK